MNLGGEETQIFSSLQPTTQPGTVDKVVLCKTKFLLSWRIQTKRKKKRKLIYTIISCNDRCYENKIRQSKKMKNDKDEASREDLAKETALEQRLESTDGMSNAEV